MLYNKIDDMDMLRYYLKLVFCGPSLWASNAVFFKESNVFWNREETKKKQRAVLDNNNY